MAWIPDYLLTGWIKLPQSDNEEPRLSAHPGLGLLLITFQFIIAEPHYGIAWGGHCK